MHEDATREGRLSRTSSAPPCSIVIPAWNRVDLTRQCLEALLSVTPACTAGVVVIDNGSCDGTADYLRSLGDRVRVIENATNEGFARACNRAARVALRRFLQLNDG